MEKALVTGDRGISVINFIEHLDELNWDVTDLPYGLDA